MKCSSLAGAALLLLAGNAAMADERASPKSVTKREIVRSAMDDEAVHKKKAPVAKEIETEHGADTAPPKVMAATEDTDNLARSPDARATQSNGHNAWKAIDGNTSGRYADGSVTHTNHEGETDPWWRVDLGTSALIRTIKVWNRSDCCADTQRRINGARVEILTEVGGTPVASGTLEWVEHQLEYDFSFADVRGRYVQVRLKGESRILSLAEVEVYGPPPTPAYHQLGNGYCADRIGRTFSKLKLTGSSPDDCARGCTELESTVNKGLVGFEREETWSTELGLEEEAWIPTCNCLFENEVDCQSTPQGVHRCWNPPIRSECGVDRVRIGMYGAKCYGMQGPAPAPAPADSTNTFTTCAGTGSCYACFTWAKLGDGQCLGTGVRGLTAVPGDQFGDPGECIGLELGVITKAGSTSWNAAVCAHYCQDTHNSNAITAGFVNEQYICQCHSGHPSTVQAHEHYECWSRVTSGAALKAAVAADGAAKEPDKTVVADAAKDRDAKIKDLEEAYAALGAEHAALGAELAAMRREAVAEAEGAEGEAKEPETLVQVLNVIHG